MRTMIDAETPEYAAFELSADELLYEFACGECRCRPDSDVYACGFCSLRPVFDGAWEENYAAGMASARRHKIDAKKAHDWAIWHANDRCCLH